MKEMLGASEITILKPGESLKRGWPTVETPLGTLQIEITGDPARWVARMRKQLSKLEPAIAAAKARLSKTAFLAKAPTDVVEGTRRKLKEDLLRSKRLRHNLKLME